MTEWDFYDDNKSVKTGRCDGCKHCRTVYATGQWEFNGCYHPPYRGKWVAEIKVCPMMDGERKGDDD